MKNKTINKIMKKILVFIIALMSFNSIAQTKIYNQPVKYRITPNLSVVDSILTKSSSDLLTATSVEDFKTQIGDSFFTKTESDNRYLQLTGGTITGTTLYDKTISEQESANIKTVVNREFVEDYVANNAPTPDLTGLVPYVGAINDVDLGNHSIKLGKEVTVANKGVHEVYLYSNDVSIFTKQKSYWNGSTYVNTNGYGFGTQALQNNTGSSSNGFGQQALQNNTGAISNGFGYFALENNTGSASNGFGYYALKDNTGANSNGFGYYALKDNTGVSSNGFGGAALENNTGANSNGFGFNALQNNTGANSNAFGHFALYNNTGVSSNGFGSSTLIYNDYDNNTAVGHNSFSEFYADTSNPITFLGSDVDVANDIITINAHGLGSVGKIFNVRAVAPNFLGGLTSIYNNYRFEVVDANTLKSLNNITSKDDGLTYTFHKQIAISNTTTIGANSQPTKSNQVVLGDTNVEEVLTYGVFKSEADYTDIFEPKHVPNLEYLSNEYFNKVDSDDRYVNVTGDTMTGDLTAPNFIGNGSGLTNVSSIQLTNQIGRDWNNNESEGWIQSTESPNNSGITGYVDSFHFGHKSGTSIGRALNVRHSNNNELYYSYNINDGVWNHYKLWSEYNFNPSDYLLTTGKAADSNLLDGVSGEYYTNRNVSIESNLDTKYDIDFFGWNNLTVGRPDGYGQGLTFVSSGIEHNNSNNWITQLGFSTSNKAYFRTKVNSSAWGDWNELYHSGNFAPDDYEKAFTTGGSTETLSDTKPSYMYWNFGSSSTLTIPTDLTNKKWILATSGQTVNVSSASGVTITVIENGLGSSSSFGGGGTSASATLIRVGTNSYHLIK